MCRGDLFAFACLAQVACASLPWKDVLDSGVELCHLQSASLTTGSLESVHVFALPGNLRAVAFGDGKSVETMVSCKARDEDSTLPPLGCDIWPRDRAPVSDATMCPSCPCVQDTSGEMQSSSNALLFSLAIGPACQFATDNNPVDVLLFGMGGGAVHTYTVQNCPKNTRVESVEADSRMAAIATRYFGVPVRKGISMVDVDDATAAAVNLAERLTSEKESPVDASFQQTMLTSGSMLRARRHKAIASQAKAESAAMGKKKWDVVVTDCFVDKGVTPESCRSREFISYVRLLVRPGGTVLHHMWHTSPYDNTVATAFDETLQLYKDIYGDSNVNIESVPRPEGARWDSVLVVKA